MSIFTQSFFILNHRVRCDYYGDPEVARYTLVGERFNQNTEILKLLARYNGACTDDPTRYATANPCSLNCTQCERSIYHIIRLKERFFSFRCHRLCDRHPRQGDVWEVSLIYKPGIGNRMKYEDYCFTAMTNMDDMTILEVIYFMMVSIDPRTPDLIQFCYMKVKRFDTDIAIDISSVANDLIQKMLANDPRFQRDNSGGI